MSIMWSWFVTPFSWDSSKICYIWNFFYHNHIMQQKFSVNLACLIESLLPLLFLSNMYLQPLILFQLIIFSYIALYYRASTISDHHSFGHCLWCKSAMSTYAFALNVTWNNWNMFFATSKELSYMASPIFQVIFSSLLIPI